MPRLGSFQERTMTKKEELDHLKNEVLRMARGRWGAILGTLAPQLQAALDRVGHHVPCPMHGGKDGFRVFRDVDDTGGTVCNTRGIHADGFATLMWANGWRFSTALRAVADYQRMGTSMTPVPRARPVLARRRHPEDRRIPGDHRQGDGRDGKSGDYSSYLPHAGREESACRVAEEADDLSE